MQNRGRGRMMSQRTFSKPKNRKYVLVRLAKYVVEFKWWFLIALALTVGSNLFALIGPYLSGEALTLVDEGVGKIDLTRIYEIAGMMMLFYLLSSVFSYILSIIMMKTSKKIIQSLRQDVFDKLCQLPVSFFDKTPTGDIISRMSYDIDTINTSLSHDIIQIATSAITIIGSLVMMIIISPLLVLVFVVTIPISLLFTRFMLRRTHALFKRRSQSLGELNGYVEEMISGEKTIKAYGNETKVLRDFDEINNEATLASYKAEYYGSITGPGVNFVNNLSLSLICLFGSLLYLFNPNFKLGKISSFVLYSRKFSGPINEIANIFTDIQSSLAAAERVFNLLDEPNELEDKIDAAILNDALGQFDFENVSFGYLESKIILENLNLHIKPGQMVAIVGPTGAGKTTIVNLLMRFYDCNSGDILIDNESIYNITRQSLRKNYAMVLQDTWLFEGTVYDNIAYGANNPTKEDVVNAAKLARIHSFIERLPNGYDTVLSDDGINISKGQKQLLTIARVMLTDAKVLILDEATSNVDTQTEKRIQEAMNKLMENKTSFVIAHRLSTIENADVILVVNNGKIVEKGTHLELLNQKGFYYELYISQYQ